MSFFPACQTVLYTISTALLYPVVISLILLTVWLLVHSGGFAGEWIKRRRMTADAADAMEAICEQRALPAELAAELPYPVAAYAEKLSKLAEEGDRFTAERVESLNQRPSWNGSGRWTGSASWSASVPAWGSWAPSSPWEPALPA